MRAKVEYDENPDSGKFRIRMQTCDLVFSPWTPTNKVAYIRYGLDLLIATGRTRFLDRDGKGLFLEAGKMTSSSSRKQRRDTNVFVNNTNMKVAGLQTDKMYVVIQIRTDNTWYLTGYDKEEDVQAWVTNS